MRVKEKIRLTVRGYRLIHALVPGMLAVMVLRALCLSLTPFINIVLSARIITALAEGASVRQILLLVALTAALNALGLLLNAGLERLFSWHQAKFWQVWERPIHEKIERMDYERVEDAATHQMKEHIRAMGSSNGLGLQRLFWCFTDIVRGTVSVLCSVTLLGGAFTATHGADTGGWSFLFSPLSAILVAVLIAVISIVNVITTNRSMKQTNAAYMEFVQSNRLGNYYYHYLINYKCGKDLKLYALIRPVTRELGKFFDVCSGVMGKVVRILTKYDGIAAVSNTALTGVIYAFVALKALLGSFGVGSIVQYIGCLSQLTGGVSGLMTNLTSLDVNAEALSLYFRFLDMPDEKYRGTIPVEKRSDNEYELEFRHVSFRYPGSDVWSLRHLDLKLKVGQRLAVVGMNGSGKTTMIKLLCRLYDPTEGMITLNGIDIRKYAYEEYLGLFSVVFQDFTLFSFELGQNVAAGVRVDGERAAEALSKSGFAERLATMPKGLGTPLYKDFDEDGVEISGGEAQKIALARALYKNAPFVVLDEPTAALDPLAEYEIYSRFNDIAGDRTAVYISHRLSSCRFCDDIAVFHEGRLIQRGSHGELLQEPGGKYSELWNAQAQYYA